MYICTYVEYFGPEREKFRQRIAQRVVVSINKYLYDYCQAQVQPVQLKAQRPGPELELYIKFGLPPTIHPPSKLNFTLLYDF